MIITITLSGINVNFRVAASSGDTTYSIEDSKEEIELAIEGMELQLEQIKEETLNELLSEVQNDTEIKQAINNVEGLNLDSLLDEAERINDIDETAQMFINELENVEECQNIVDELEQQLTLKTLEDYEEQDVVNVFTNKTINTVEEMKEYLEMLDYSVDNEAYSICEEAELYKEENEKSTLVEQVENLNEVLYTVDDSSIDNGITFGTKVNAASASVTYNKWRNLSTDEKVLIATDPKKALATNTLAKKAYQWTADKFGKNGLGDKSDAFRHATWNALMTRDISRQWAKLYATAHESGKSSADLEKKAGDGYKEKYHKAMDLHNNMIGRETIKWYDTAINVNDKKLKERVSKKLTNNKKTGAYWLHS